MIASDTVVVTGAAGFVGSSLARELLAAGRTVIGVDCFTGPNHREVQHGRASQLTSLGARFIHTDLRRIGVGGLSRLIPPRSSIVHLAALPGVRPSWGSRRSEYVETNVGVTRLVVDAARESGAARLVYASSSSVYGNSAGPMSESTRTCPISPYGRTKLGGELTVRRAAARGELDAVVVRYFTVYGPRQRPDMAIARFITALFGDRPIRLFGPGCRQRDFTYVDDIVRGTIAALDLGRSGGIYNLGSASPAELSHVLDVIAGVTGRKPRIMRTESSPGDPMSTLADTTRAGHDLGWSPKMPLEEGLARQVEAQFALNTQRRDTA